MAERDVRSRGPGGLDRGPGAEAALRNILVELEWDEHIDRDFTTITVWEHKTIHQTGAPLVSPISLAVGLVSCMPALNPAVAMCLPGWLARTFLP